MTPDTPTASPADIDAIRERYSPPPYPRCRLCDSEMHVGMIGNGRSEWYCDSESAKWMGLEYGPEKTKREQHYDASMIVVTRFGDAGVVGLCDEVERLRAALDAVTAERDDYASTLRRCSVAAADLSGIMERDGEAEAVDAAGDAAFHTDLTTVDVIVNDRIANLECEAAQAQADRDRLRATLVACHRMACTADNCELDGGPEHQLAFASGESAAGAEQPKEQP